MNVCENCGRFSAIHELFPVLKGVAKRGPYKLDNLTQCLDYRMRTCSKGHAIPFRSPVTLVPKLMGMMPSTNPSHRQTVPRP